MYQVYGEGDKYFRAAASADAALPLCPFCGRPHAWEMEAEEGFSVTYRIRCSACGGVLSLESMSANPFREPFVTLNSGETGSVNASGLLSDSMYSVEALNDAARRIVSSAQAQQGARTDALKAQITADATHRAAVSRQDGNAYGEQPKAAVPRPPITDEGAERAHRERHASAGICQDSHVFGEQPELSTARVVSSDEDEENAHREKHEAAGACQDNHVYGEPRPQRQTTYEPESQTPTPPPAGDWDPFGQPKKPKLAKVVAGIVITIVVLIFIMGVMIKMFEITSCVSQLSAPHAETVCTAAVPQELNSQNSGKIPYVANTYLD